MLKNSRHVRAERYERENRAYANERYHYGRGIGEVFAEYADIGSERHNRNHDEIEYEGCNLTGHFGCAGFQTDDKHNKSADDHNRLFDEEDKENYQKWNEAKAIKDFETADIYRNKLIQKGIL